ncbi:MAG TPA: tryptophan--tRNA ligase [Phycisphaerae bacterium]|nr:tryptophan--tRNA ligase [Phycisphaerae bacterium]HNU44113.1 tryptophan--tRNA ligase [Phycisphaerae bacterium]
MRVLSGIQPSGKLHLGNYLAAMKQHIELEEKHDCYYFIANYHALTTIQDAPTLVANTRDVALDYLAMGFDPTKALLFRQSDVPEVTELTWLLSVVTGKGLLDRATSYKDKVARGIAASMGLFSYPILMAADILIYHSDVVPVGKDQVQHIEMAQDMATHFNMTFKCEVFKRPEAKLNEALIVPGLDGQKMSKSYGNAVSLFDDAKTNRKRIMSIKTDSTPLEAPKDPERCTVFGLYKLLATPAETQALEQRYRAGGMGYGEAKQMLADVVERLLGPARERRAELVKDADYVEDMLRTAGRRARETARAVMEQARAACGIVTARN